MFKACSNLACFPAIVGISIDLACGTFLAESHNMLGTHTHTRRPILRSGKVSEALASCNKSTSGSELPLGCGAFIFSHSVHPSAFISLSFLVRVRDVHDVLLHNPPRRKPSPEVTFIEASSAGLGGQTGEISAQG